MVASRVEKDRVRLDQDVVVEAQGEHGRVVDPDVGATLDGVAGHHHLVVPRPSRKPGCNLADMDFRNGLVYFVFSQKNVVVGSASYKNFDEQAHYPKQ